MFAAVRSLEQCRTGVVRIEHEYVFDGIQLSAVGEPATDLERQVAEEGALDVERPQGAVLPRRIRLGCAGQRRFEAVALRRRPPREGGAGSRHGCASPLVGRPPSRRRGETRPDLFCDEREQDVRRLGEGRLDHVISQ